MSCAPAMAWAVEGGAGLVSMYLPLSAVLHLLEVIVLGQLFPLEMRRI